MAKILYAGHAIAVPDNVDVDELAAVLLDTYAKGAYVWVTFYSTGDQQQQVRFLSGPGIAVGIVSDQKGGREEGMSTGASEEVIDPAKDSGF